TVDNVDDAIKENPEDYKVAITDNTDGGYEVVGLGNTEVTTTIVDNDTAPEANGNTNTATETGSEFITTEDERNDGQSATGNVITDPTADIGTNPLSITEVVFNNISYDLPTDGTDLDINGAYGLLTINNTGSYKYNVNEDTTDSWNTDRSETDTFTYTLSDGINSDDTADLEITVNGMDDAPVINSITANDQAMHTINGIIDIGGDSNDIDKVPNNFDFTDGSGDSISASDILNGNGRDGIQFNENNGNITIDMGTQDSSMAVQYHGGNAGYRNVLGYYEKDDDGNITDCKVIYVDKGDDDGDNRGFDKFLGEHAINLGTLNDLNGEVGFFIVPNAYSNRDIANIIDSENSSVSIGADNKVTFTDGTNTTPSHIAYYTDNNMSTDGIDH
ncbi:MAG: VCBS domain-containing protein, partial [Campylobacterota bacterium]|nr:VCBS domain-containing protein [Campylobacterota bacterium]